MPRFTCGSCAEQFRSGLIALFLVLNGAVVALAQPGDAKPSTRPEAERGLAAGLLVVLKEGNTPLHDEGRLITLGDYLRVAVERIDGGRVLLASRDGKRRGWVSVDQIVPDYLAIVYFDGVVAKDPKNADAHWMRGRLRFRDAARAEADLDRAIELGPKQAWYYLSRSTLRLQGERFDLVIADCNKAIELDPKLPLAYLNRGMAWTRKREYARAKADLDEAIHLDGTDPIAWYERYQCWMHEGNRENAAKDFDEAVRFAPKGSLLDFVPGYPERAQQGLAEVIDLQPKNAWDHVMRGVAWREMGQLDKAIADFTEAIKLDPKSALYFDLLASAHVVRAGKWEEMGQLDKAIADFTEAIKLDPKSALYFKMRGGIRLKKKEFAKAVADLSEVIKLNPKYDYVYAQRGGAWEEMRQLDQAIADFTEAINLNPKQDWYFQLRARVWLKKSELNKAIADFTEAINLNPQKASHFTFRRRSGSRSRNSTRPLPTSPKPSTSNPWLPVIDSYAPLPGAATGIAPRRSRISTRRYGSIPRTRAASAAVGGSGCWTGSPRKPWPTSIARSSSTPGSRSHTAVGVVSGR